MFYHIPIRLPLVTQNKIFITMTGNNVYNIMYNLYLIYFDFNTITRLDWNHNYRYIFVYFYNYWSPVSKNSYLLVITILDLKLSVFFISIFFNFFNTITSNNISNWKKFELYTYNLEFFRATMRCMGSAGNILIW